MSASVCLSASCLETPHPVEMSSPQAASMRQLRRERAFAVRSEVALPRPRLSSLAPRAQSGGLSQEALDTLCQDSCDAEGPVCSASGPGVGMAQSLLDALAVVAESDDEEELDGQLARRRRCGVFAPAAAEALTQEELDLLCIDADDGDEEDEASFHHDLRRARAYAGADRVATLQALAEATLGDACADADDDAESEDSLHRSLRRARAYGGADCAEALRRAALSEASTDTASCATPSSSASEDGSESPCALLRVRRARAFEGPQRAAELVAELVAESCEVAEVVAEVARDPAEVLARSPVKAQSTSPGSPVGKRILKAASPNRRRFPASETA